MYFDPQTLKPYYGPGDQASAGVPNDELLVFRIVNRSCYKMLK